MINIYSPKDIDTIRQGGKILGNIMNRALAQVIPGISTLELDHFVDQEILSAGGKPSFKMEKGYSFATCMCVNDMVVHGIPTTYQLKEGDRLGIDMGVYYRGFHTDASWSIEVKSEKLKVQISRNVEILPKAQSPSPVTKFLGTGEQALNEAIKKCVPGNHIGDISKTIQDIVEGGGYSCVKQLVGHGVGRILHEDPEIPCYLRGRIENTPLIKAGMVLAVEVIYNMGQSPVIYENDDGWTIVTRDGLPSGLFEHTVAVTKNAPEILTLAS